MKAKFIILQVVCLSSAALADFQCDSAVNYVWKNKGGKHESFWKTVTATAADEAGTKAALDDAVSFEKGLAIAKCRKDHENLSGCIAQRYQSIGSTYESMGFKARKTLDEAIINDCQKKQGYCLEPKASNPICKDLSPAPAETEGEGGGDDEKDSKKDKKKKKK
ncbi:MAG: hypothetical protein H6619_00785 [Deltaproteobacteria bacterium]|nr:hypothetical protein [Deltaproteobacteria bacterium]